MCVWKWKRSSAASEVSMGVRHQNNLRKSTHPVLFSPIVNAQCSVLSFSISIVRCYGVQAQHESRNRSSADPRIH